MLMIELNKELTIGVLERLNYLKVLYNINPNLAIPLDYLSPAVSKLKNNYIAQHSDIPPFYHFIFSSIYDMRDSKIEDGSKIYELIEKLDPGMMEDISEGFFMGGISKECYLEDCDIEKFNLQAQVFEKYLVECNVHCLQFKLNFVSKYTDKLVDLIDGIAASIMLDTNTGNGMLIGYEVEHDIAKEMYVIKLWYFLDGYTGHYPVLSENKEIKEIFEKILEEEAL